MLSPGAGAVNAEHDRAFVPHLDNNATCGPSYRRRFYAKETTLTETLARVSGWSGARMFAGLVFLTGIGTLGFWILATRGATIPREVEVLWDVAFRLFLIAWVRADRRSHFFSASYEFDAFLFFAWPAAMPYYFYKTRGARGLFTAFGVFVLLTVPETVWGIVHTFTTMR